MLGLLLMCNQNITILMYTQNQQPPPKKHKTVEDKEAGKQSKKQKIVRDKEADDHSYTTEETARDDTLRELVIRLDKRVESVERQQASISKKLDRLIDVVQTVGQAQP